MIITYNKNPLHTIVELDNNEKKELWYKIKINALEDNISIARLYLIEGKNFDIEQARIILKNEYDENDNSKLDKWCDEMLEYYIFELSSNHSGDCTCVACSCSKCSAEELLGIDTIKGLGKHSAYKIERAFGTDNSNSIEEALIYLKNYTGIPDDVSLWKSYGGYEQYIPRWKEEARIAYDWLLKYKIEKLNGE